jgi:ribosomal protein S18 acetylase RimI-like enzyme
MPAVPRFLQRPPIGQQLQAAILHALAEWTDQIDRSDRLRLPGILVLRPRRTYMPALLLIGGLRHQDAPRSIDHALTFLRDGPRNQAICWAAAPLRPRALGAYLLARGFEMNWNSHWMLRDLHPAPPIRPTPPNLIIHQALSQPNEDLTHLPYYEPTEAAQLIAAGQQQPRTIWQLFGQIDGRIVAQCVLQLTYGRRGIATIRNVGVDPTARRRGYGSAITSAALKIAKEAGCQYALLSATDEGALLYQQLGFQSLERVPTWLLRPDVLAHTPLPNQQVALAQAAGLGQIEQITTLANAHPEWIDAALPTTLTPLRIATIMGQHRSVERLAAHGATLDIVSAWELGLRDVAARLLAEQPALANYRIGRWALTPLHYAIQAGDLELARLILSANPDLSIRDSGFASTPLGWAIHFQRETIAAMIRAHLPDDPL